MVDIYGSHFEYGGVSSRQYGLMIATVETERNRQVSGSIEGVSVFNRNTKKRFLIDDDYSEFPVSYEVEIVTDDEQLLEAGERREIEKWLFNKHSYRKLYLDVADDTRGETYEIIDGLQKRLYMNCRFVNPERLEYNGGVVGYRATLEADSGLWWQDAVTKTFTFPNATPIDIRHLVINVDTDLDDYTYPKVTVTTGNYGGEIIVYNNTDDNHRNTKFVGISSNATITLRGDINYVSGDYYDKFSVRNFPRLLDGENDIVIMGNIASISFEFNNRRML